LSSAACVLRHDGYFCLLESFCRIFNMAPSTQLLRRHLVLYILQISCMMSSYETSNLSSCANEWRLVVPSAFSRKYTVIILMFLLTWPSESIKILSFYSFFFYWPVRVYCRWYWTILCFFSKLSCAVPSYCFLSDCIILAGVVIHHHQTT
jgi:hypothetical protein